MRRPQAPKHLDDTAGKKWRELLPTLPDVDVGTLDALAQYCVAWSAWIQAEEVEDKIRWSRCCRQWAAELKLTPKSRTARKPTEEDTDPVLRLISSK